MLLVPEPLLLFEKGKANPIQAWACPQCSSRLSFISY